MAPGAGPPPDPIDREALRFAPIDVRPPLTRGAV